MAAAHGAATSYRNERREPVAALRDVDGPAVARARRELALRIAFHAELASSAAGDP